MSRTVLFSTVGRTDPIDTRNYRDGATLHIIRHRKVDEVCLYLSAEMCRYEDKDRRYSLSVERLAGELGRPVKISVVRRPELTDVHLFDAVYGDLEDVLLGIRDTLDKDDRILINISSGTPAFKSALVCIATLRELPCTLVQVDAPDGGRKGTKAKPEDLENYDPDSYWELNEDRGQEPGTSRRCHDAACPSLMRLNDDNILARLVRSLDFRAARSMIRQYPAERTAAWKPYLSLALALERLDMKEAERLDTALGTDIFDSRWDDAQKTVFAYALGVGLRYRRGELTDFLRSLTPLIADLFQRALLRKSVDISLYQLRENDGRRVSTQWDGEFILDQSLHDRIALRLTEILHLHDSGKKSKLYVNSDHLMRLIRSCYGKNSELCTEADMLREVEMNLRNIAAHEIVAIDERRCQSLTGNSPKVIMDRIRGFFELLDGELLPRDSPRWDAFDMLVNRIEQLINPYKAQLGTTKDRC